MLNKIKIIQKTAIQLLFLTIIGAAIMMSTTACGGSGKRISLKKAKKLSYHFLKVYTEDYLAWIWYDLCKPDSVPDRVDSIGNPEAGDFKYIFEYSSKEGTCPRKVYVIPLDEWEAGKNRTEIQIYSAVNNDLLFWVIVDDSLMKIVDVEYFSRG